MSTINLFPGTTVPVASDARVANQLIGSANQLTQTMLNAYLSGYNQMWNNTNATPDKIVAALGTNAVKLFTAADALATFLVAEGVTGLSTGIPIGWTFTANADGSATVAKSI